MFHSFLPSSVNKHLRSSYSKSLLTTEALKCIVKLRKERPRAITGKWRGNIKAQPREPKKSA
jgi:hypothetical protein